jgi:hypothetical protein
MLATFPHVGHFGDQSQFPQRAERIAIEGIGT